MTTRPGITVTAHPAAPHRSAEHIALMVTRRCNMTCSHCSVESSPHAEGVQPNEQELLTVVRQAAAAGVTSIQFTGGEPMMRQKLVLRLMREAQRLGVRSAMATNGFWGRTPAAAMRHLRALIKAHPAHGQLRSLPRGVPGPRAGGQHRRRGAAVLVSRQRQHHPRGRRAGPRRDRQTLRGNADGPSAVL